MEQIQYIEGKFHKILLCMNILVIICLLTSFETIQIMSNSSHISVGCRVEGAFGPLVDNPNPKVKRRVRERVCGTVIKAVDQRRWEIVSDIDGEIKIITSNALKVVPDEFGVPLYEEVSLFVTIVIYLFLITNFITSLIKITGE